MNTLEEKPMTPAERMYKNHLKNVATYQKKNPEKCKEKMRRNNKIRIIKEFKITIFIIIISNDYY